jgi:RNA polymerase sigma-70 factor (ECF subfamily)
MTSCIDDTDGEVAGLVERGDFRAALHHLMKRHRPRVYHYCSTALRDPALADDVCQQIFIEAYRDLSRFHGRSKIRIWLLGIARHRILDASKARRRRRAYLQDAPDADAFDPRPSPAEALDERRRRAALARSLERLDDRAQRALRLRYHEGLTFEEMATVCREKPATLAARVARALPVLRADLESRRRVSRSVGA